MSVHSVLTEKDIEDGKKINEIFEFLSPEAKLQAQAYMSALRDKELAMEEMEKNDIENAELLEETKAQRKAVEKLSKKPTLNNMRKEHGLEPLFNGDVVLTRA